MKLLHVTFPFEFTEQVERLLDNRNVQDYVRMSMAAGRDAAGKHQGTQVYPGNLTVIQAHIPDEAVDDLLDALQTFRDARKTHQTLTAAVLPVERSLGGEDGNHAPDLPRGQRLDE